MSSVRVRGLCKSFDQVRAVDDISFDVPSGTILTMLGPSGCGKTTILRCIAGLEMPDAGRIVIGDDTVFADGVVRVPAERRNLGMVFQTYAIWPHMTVFENVAFGLRVRRRSRREVGAAVRKALALVRLTDLEHRFPGQLSGGQMQRVVLARCLAYEPGLLLLDEPLANLDTNLREEMRAELKRVQRETGTTMILVTHDQAEALSVSDRVLVMAAGHVLQSGAPWDIVRKPATAEVAGFLGAVNSFPAEHDVAGMLRVPGVGTLTTTTPATGSRRVRVLVRPDAIVISPANGTPSDGQWHGTIESAQYLGRGVQYAVACGPLRLLVEHHGTDRPLAEGTAVSLRIPAAALRVFPEEQR